MPVVSKLRVEMNVNGQARDRALDSNLDDVFKDYDVRITIKEAKESGVESNVKEVKIGGGVKGIQEDDELDLEGLKGGKVIMNVDKRVDGAKLIEDEESMALSSSCPNVTLSWRRVHRPYEVTVKGSIVGKPGIPDSVEKLKPVYPRIDSAPILTTELDETKDKDQGKKELDRDGCSLSLSEKSLNNCDVISNSTKTKDKDGHQLKESGDRSAGTRKDANSDNVDQKEDVGDENQEVDVNNTFVEMDTVKIKQVVSPKNSPVLIEAEARNEGCEKGEKSYSIRLENNKFSLIHPVVSPCPSPDEEGVDGEGVQQRIYMIDDDCKLGELENNGNLEYTLAGSKSIGTKGKKQPTKAGGRRQTMIPLSPSARGTGGRGAQGNRERILSPVKKGKFVSGGSGGATCNLYCIRIKNHQFLVVFAEDGMRQMNYRFPGTQRKAWCTAFERDLRNESAWSGANICPISSIVKRRDIREEGDIFLAQRTSVGFPMTAYMCPMDEDDTPFGISNEIVSKLNEYASHARNNMKTFRFVSDITEEVDDDDLHALDYWILTRDIVTAISSLYEEEIEDGTFYNFEGLVEGLFERSKNTENVRETMARHM